MNSNNKKTVRIIDTISINKNINPNTYFESISTEDDSWADYAYSKSIEILRQQNVSNS